MATYKTYMKTYNKISNVLQLWGSRGQFSQGFHLSTWGGGFVTVSPGNDLLGSRWCPVQIASQTKNQLHLTYFMRNHVLNYSEFSCIFGKVAVMWGVAKLKSSSYCHQLALPAKNCDRQHLKLFEFLRETEVGLKNTLTSHTSLHFVQGRNLNKFNSFKNRNLHKFNSLLEITNC
jgi:hypothetical protein